MRYEESEAALSAFLSDAASIERVIGYSFRDRSLLRQAFTRTSFCNEANKERRDGTAVQSNEVVEFFGDSVLSTVIVTLLIRDCSDRYPYGIRTTLGEGDFSAIRSKLSDKKNLSLSMKELGLQKYLLMGEGDEKIGVENQPSVMEDLFESIVGAVYIDSDGDLDAARGVVLRMLDLDAYLKCDPAEKQSAKNRLQNFCQDPVRRFPKPVYQTVSESGPDHKKTFTVVCSVGDRVLCEGTGKNRKIAEEAAAEASLALLLSEEAEMPKTCDASRRPSETSMSRLNEFAQKLGGTAPAYFTEQTPDSTKQEPHFSAVCRFRHRQTTAEGKSKKSACQAAAEAMLDLLTAEKK